MVFFPIKYPFLIGRIFAQVVFCGPSGNSDKFASAWPKFSSHLPLFIATGGVEMTQINSYLCLPCFLDQYQLQFNYEGAILMSDDVVLNYWNLKWKDLNKLWAMKQPREQYVFDIDTVE